MRFALVACGVALCACGSVSESPGGAGSSSSSSSSSGNTSAPPLPGSSSGAPAGLSAKGCAAYGTTLFCDDFESPASSAQYWQKTDSSGWSLPAFGPQPGAFSGANVLHAEATSTGNGSVWVMASRRMSSLPAVSTLHASLAVRSMRNDASYRVLQLDAYPTDAPPGARGGFEAQINVSGGTATLDVVDFNPTASFDKDAGVRSIQLAQLKADAWTVIDLTMDFVDEPGVRATVDAGAPTAKITFVPSPAGYKGAYGLALDVGAGSVMQGKTNIVDIDDVVIR